ncbi:hypothetical protein KP509_1Z054500 [Ceratopteris richardii]|nr:hypothetical protein KP509_1Z054500 [Ceratopteris richardii]
MQNLNERSEAIHFFFGLVQCSTNIACSILDCVLRSDYSSQSFGLVEMGSVGKTKFVRKATLHKWRCYIPKILKFRKTQIWAILVKDTAENCQNVHVKLIANIDSTLQSNLLAYNLWHLDQFLRDKGQTLIFGQSQHERLDGLCNMEEALIDMQHQQAS